MTDLSRGAYLVELECSLSFDGPVHVGTGERLSIVSDAPVLRTATGTPYLPGQSIRGVLRDWCEREAPRLGVCREHVTRLFGQPRAAATGDRQGRLSVADVELPARDEVRDHVRIDECHGAAASGGKFDQEVVYPERAVLELRYEGDGPDDPELLLVQEAARALEAGVLAFGGTSGSGLGWVSEAATTWRVLDRSAPAALGAYLSRRLNGAQPKPSAAPVVAKRSPRAREAREPKPWSWLTVALRLQFDGPMLVAGPDRRPGDGLDLVEAVYLTDPTGADAILPGSSLRGVLRSHAARVARGTGATTSAETLFGPGNASRRGLLLAGEGRIAGRNDAERRDNQKAVRLDHVAIDRLTGFAATQRLFDAIALASPTFATRLLVRWHADDEAHLRAVALLLFILRDAEKGALWVGSRTTRGYGWLERIDVESAKISAAATDGSSRDTRPLQGTAVAEFAQDPALVEALEAWRRHLEAAA